MLLLIFLWHSVQEGLSHTAKPTSSPMSTATHTYKDLVILQSTPQGCLVFLSTSGPVLVILCVRVARDGREVWICVCWCSCFRQRGGLSLSWQPCDRLSCSVLTTVYTNILNNTLIRQWGLPFPSASFHVSSQLSFPPVLLLLCPLLSNDL